MIADTISYLVWSRVGSSEDLQNEEKLEGFKRSPDLNTWGDTNLSRGTTIQHNLIYLSSSNTFQHS